MLPVECGGAGGDAWTIERREVMAQVLLMLACNEVDDDGTGRPKDDDG